MAPKANREWQDLPKRLNCFTVRNATMIDLDTKEVIRYYSANTKISVVQKCVTPEGTYYRTAESALHGLDHAFKGTAFGLPDEEAPSAPSKLSSNKLKSAISHVKPGSKNKHYLKTKLSPMAEGLRLKRYLTSF